MTVGIILAAKGREVATIEPGTTLKSAVSCRGGGDRLRRRASAALAHCTSVAPAHQPSPIQNRMHATICHHAPAEKRWTSSFSIASAR